MPTDGCFLCGSLPVFRLMSVTYVYVFVVYKLAVIFFFSYLCKKFNYN